MKSLKKVLNKILEVVCIAIFAFITIIGLYQIITRYVFNAPSTVSEELLTFHLHGIISCSLSFWKTDHMENGI